MYHEIIKKIYEHQIWLIPIVFPIISCRILSERIKIFHNVQELNLHTAEDFHTVPITHVPTAIQRLAVYTNSNKNIYNDSLSNPYEQNKIDT